MDLKLVYSHIPWFSFIQYKQIILYINSNMGTKKNQTLSIVMLEVQISKFIRC